MDNEKLTVNKEEFLKRAKEAESAGKIADIAKEYGLELNEIDAAAYYNMFHKHGEIPDSELDASGGGLKYHDRIIITHLNSCHQFRCAKCGRNEEQVQMDWKYNTPSCSSNVFCCNCQYFSYDTIFWVCNNYDHNHDKP